MSKLLTVKNQSPCRFDTDDYKYHKYDAYLNVPIYYNHTVNIILKASIQMCSIFLQYLITLMNTGIIEVLSV